MLVLFLITAVGTATWLLMLAFGSNSDFIAGFNGLLGANAYQDLIETAANTGFAADPSQSGRSTFYALIYAFQMYGGFQMIGYFSGEIKRVQRSAILAIMTALVVGALFFIIGSILVVNYFGADFVSALAFLGNEAPDQLNLPLGPYLSSMIIFMTQNPILRIIMALGFLATITWILLPQLLIITRNLFAWSFDRLIPQWVADVNERTHSPVKATIIAAVLAYVMLLATFFTPLWAYLVNLSGVSATIGMLLSISAIIFPYRRKDIFEKAPDIVKRRVAGFPILTWAGIFTLLTQLVVGYVTWTTPSIGGPVTLVSLLASFSMFLIAFPIYLIPYFVNKRRGLDTALAYKELPPE